MAATREQSFTTTWAGINDVDIVLDTPALENDVIILHLSIAALGFTQAATTDWTNLLGPNNTQITVADSTAGGCIMYHVVDAAEEAAETVNWQLTNVFAVPESGDGIGVVWRGLDLTALLHISGEAENVAIVTPHVLAGIPGGSITLTGAPVVSWLIKDGLGTYTTPAGVTLVESTNTNMATWLGQRDVASSAGIDVPAINITPSGSDEYLSLTYILTPEPGAADDFTETPVDNVGITDSTEQSLGVEVSDTDDVGITDSITVTAGTLVETADNIGITDDVVVAHDEVFELPADAVGITDASLGFDFSLIVNDIIGLDDSITSTIILNPTEVDDVGITEDVVVAIDKVFELAGDGIGITDSIQFSAPLLLADQVGIIDPVTLTLHTVAAVTPDLIGITDHIDRVLSDINLDSQNICLEFGLPVFVTRPVGMVFQEREVALVFQERAASLTMQDRDASLTFVNREAGVDLGCEE